MVHTLLLTALVMTAQPATEPWTPAVQQRIAMVSSRLMPAALASQMSRHSGELKAGAAAPFNSDESAEYHALHADGQAGMAPLRVEQQITKIVTLLNNRAPFRQIVFEFGVLGHYVADTAWPLATSDIDPNEARYAPDMAHYVASNLKKYPPVFDGFFPFNEQEFSPRDYLQEVAGRANRFYPLIGRAYDPKGDGRLVSSRSFDDRSPAFGIAQISYNHAVSAVANVWLFAWREAHGDLDGAAAQTRKLLETHSSRSAERSQ